jgi:CubicO group peptidase (beta-lactamase class C family)
MTGSQRADRRAGPRSAELAGQLRELIARHGVVGASAGIWHDGRATTWSAGVTNCLAGDATRPATLFHLASITKVFTATIVLQLVGEGLLTLDQPVSSLLPGLAAAEAAGPLTIRSLLSHTSGIDADFHLDTGRGDDALARFASRVGAIQRPYRPGHVFSYGNAGYSMLGRVVEVVTQDVWDHQLRQRVLRPLGMTRTTATPEQALRWPFAVGHMRTVTGLVRPVTGWPLPRSVGPAGVLCSTAEDMLRFASAFAGPAPPRQRLRILPRSLVAEMQAVAASEVYSAPEDHWGLGWGLYRWGTAHVLGHDGGTKGYDSYLRVLPQAGTAVVLLTNGGGNATAVFHSMFGPLLQETCGIRIPAPPIIDQPEALPAPVPADIPGLAGTYACGTWRLSVPDHGTSETVAVLHLKGLAADDMGVKSLRLDIRPISQGRFAVSKTGERGGRWPLHLVELPCGTRFVHMWRRAAREVGGG